MLNILIATLKIIFTMGFIIFVHELGHFIVAKKCNVYIKEFALGFGPKIYSKKVKETKYTLRLIPFGGYVSMLGEEEETEDERSFGKRPAYQRLLIIIAGAIVNIILGLLIYFFLSVGIGNYYSNIVKTVESNYSAQTIGIQPGDIIKKINNKKVHSKSDVDSLVRNSKGKSVIIEIIRNNESIVLEGNPTKKNIELEDGSKYELYFLGVTFENVETTIGNRIYYSLLKTKAFLTEIGVNIKMLFTGSVTPKQLMGPVGISETVAQTSSLVEFINFISLISVSLGVSNLLPFLPLDGGKAVLIIIEMIRKKKIKENVELKLQEIGFLLIMILALYITFNDIIRIVK